MGLRDWADQAKHRLFRRRIDGSITQQPSRFGESAKLIYDSPEGGEEFEILIFRPAAWDAFLQSEMGQRLQNRDCVPQSTLPGRDVQLYTIPWPHFPVSQTPRTPKEVCDFVVAKEPPLVEWGHLAIVRVGDAVIAVGDASGTAPTDTTLVEDIVADLRQR